MKTKILLLIANLMIFAMPLFATTTNSDTIWTRNLPSLINGCTFSLTGDSIISIAGEGGGDSLFILETATGKTLKSTKCKAWVYSFGGLIHFNKKSWVAISIDSDFGGLYIYDYLKDSIVNEKFGFLGKAIAIAKDDKFIYVQNSSDGNKNISIYDVEKGVVIDSISSGYGTAHSLAISPDNKYLVIGTGKLKRVYPPEYPYEEDRMFDKIVIINLEKKEVIKEFDGPSGTEGEIREIKFSADGNYLGVAKLDGNLYVYQMNNMELYRKFSIYGYSDHAGPWVISFSNNSSLLYCGLFIWNNWKTEIFDIESNKLLKSLDIYSYSGLLVDKNDYLLLGYDYYITYLKPDWLTSVKSFINEKEITNEIIISKIINKTYIYNNTNLIKNIKLYNYNGILFNNIESNFKVNNENLNINTENLQLGIYFLVINEVNTIKILVTE